MNDIHQIAQEMIHVTIGTKLTITGYHDSDGNVSDLNVELLPPEAYATMQAEDLQLLREADVATLFGDGLGDLQMTDMLAAREQLIASREKSLHNREDGGSYRGADYISIADSLCRLPDQPDVIYLRRMRTLREPADPKPAKGAIPRAKQRLAKELNLPTRWYIHTLKLQQGKFESFDFIVG